MNKLMTLFLGDAEIIITVPDFREKINYYYPPSEKLNRFDEGSVQLLLSGKKILLLKDILQEIFIPFYKMLKKVINEKIPLPQNMQKGHLGLTYNNYLNDDLLENEEIYKNFLLWSGKHIQTWIYNYKDKIYIEISPSYKWHFLEPDKDEDVTTYQDFITNYQPIAILEITKGKAQDWLNECKSLCKELEILD